MLNHILPFRDNKPSRQDEHNQNKHGVAKNDTAHESNSIQDMLPNIMTLLK